MAYGLSYICVPGPTCTNQCPQAPIYIRKGYGTFKVHLDVHRETIVCPNCNNVLTLVGLKLSEFEVLTLQTKYDGKQRSRIIANEEGKPYKEFSLSHKIEDYASILVTITQPAQQSITGFNFLCLDEDGITIFPDFQSKIRECRVCLTDYLESEFDSATLQNCQHKSTVCRSCFRDHIKTSGLDEALISEFDMKKINCSSCKRKLTSIDLRDLSGFEDLHQQFIDAENKQQELIALRIAEEKARKERIKKAQKERDIVGHRQAITELCICKCPKCAKPFGYFDGCYSVECNCGCVFCGWCLKDFSPNAHAHVLVCTLNANPGTYKGTEAQFEMVRNKTRRERIITYLKGVPVEYREEALLAVNGELSNLNIVIKNIDINIKHQ